MILQLNLTMNGTNMTDEEMQMIIKDMFDKTDEIQKDIEKTTDDLLELMKELEKTNEWLE